MNNYKDVSIKELYALGGKDETVHRLVNGLVARLNKTHYQQQWFPVLVVHRDDLMSYDFDYEVDSDRMEKLAEAMGEGICACDAFGDALEAAADGLGFARTQPK